MSPRIRHGRGRRFCVDSHVRLATATRITIPSRGHRRRRRLECDARRQRPHRRPTPVARPTGERGLLGAEPFARPSLGRNARKAQRFATRWRDRGRLPFHCGQAIVDEMIFLRARILELRPAVC
jgi:hypothetical protein